MVTESWANNYETAREIQKQIDEGKAYQDARMRGWDPAAPTPTWVKVFWGVILGGVVLFFVFIFAPRKKTESLFSAPLDQRPPPTDEFTDTETADLLAKYVANPSAETVAVFAEERNKTVSGVFKILKREGVKGHNPLVQPIEGDIVVSEGGLERLVIAVEPPSASFAEDETYTYISKSQTRTTTNENWVKWCKKNKATVRHVVGKLG